MGCGEDRLSYLPDPILQHILTMMPLKSAVRTDALSKRWRNLWQDNLCTATALEFGEDFARTLSAKEFVETINRYLQLNSSKKLVGFHVLFSPFDLFAPDIENWINYAIGKGVECLDIDLSQGFRSPEDSEFHDGRIPFGLPASLFEYRSLVELNLSRCNFGILSDFSNFSGLQSLSLSYSDVDDHMLQGFVANCPLLENLSLINCGHLQAISILLPGPKLKNLTIGNCYAAYSLEIDAPSLQSLHYFGNLCDEHNFLNISSLKEASVHSFIPIFTEDYTSIVSELSHVQILTLCTATLQHMNQTVDYDHEDPLQMLNLQELQLLMGSLTYEVLICLYSFLHARPAPLLEKLFIQLPKYVEHPNERQHGLNSQDFEVNLNNLKVIKLTNFKGSRTEMELVGFLLKKATILESLTLVLPPVSNIKDGSGKKRLVLSILCGQVSLLPKTSPVARIIVHEFGEDDGINATRKDVHNHRSCLPTIPYMHAC